MQVHESVIDLIGNTPLVRLRSVPRGVVPEGGAQVLAKVEYLNPGGSVKDRIAVRMVDAAERDGLIGPGGTIVEPTSGNTGVGLALVAQQRGYRTVFVCPDKVSEDKRNVLKAYGAEVVVCPTAVDRTAFLLQRDIGRPRSGAWKSDQYAPNNPLSHYETT
jgi:cystathionine beta-synthase